MNSQTRPSFTFRKALTLSAAAFLLSILPAFSESRALSLGVELSHEGAATESSLKHSFSCWSLAHAINAEFPEFANSAAPDLPPLSEIESFYAAKTNRELLSRDTAAQGIEGAANLSNLVAESVETDRQILNDFSDPPSIELPEEGTGFSSVEDIKLSIQIRYCHQQMEG